MNLCLILEFNGALYAVKEWLEKLELVYWLQGITELHTVMPLRPTAGAFSIYQQLTSTDKNNLSKIKAALISAFAMEKLVFSPTSSLSLTGFVVVSQLTCVWLICAAWLPCLMEN